MGDVIDPVAEHIEKHLYNDLRWLLCAATEWCAYQELVNNRRVIEDGAYPRHFIVYTMDAAFIHARALLEFFTNKDILGITTGIESNLYSNHWKGSLNHAAMHVHTRSNPYKSAVAVNDKVETITLEVLRLWDEFSKKSELQPYRQYLLDARHKALADAKVSADRYKSYAFRLPFV
jgi:hypothetical protein